MYLNVQIIISFNHSILYSSWDQFIGKILLLLSLDSARNLWLADVQYYINRFYDTAGDIIIIKINWFRLKRLQFDFNIRIQIL